MKRMFIYALAAYSMLAWACNKPAAESKVEEVEKLQEMMAVDAVVLPPELQKVEATGSGEHVKFSPPEIKANEEPEVAVSLPVSKQKLIKDGRLSIKTNHLNAGKTYLNNLVKKYGGYYQREELSNAEQRTVYDLTIRIPAAAFDAIINDIERGEGEVTSKGISTRDVTEEYVDLQLRLANKRLYLKRYQEILSRASSVKDLMAIQENIRALQEEMESAEGRLRYLSDQVTYSTINVYLFTEKPYVHKAPQEVHFWEKLKTAFSNGWGGIVGSLLVVVNIWPLLLVVVLVWWLVKKYQGRKTPTKE